MAYTYRGAKDRDDQIVLAFSPVSLLVYGDDSSNIPISLSPMVWK